MKIDLTNLYDKVLRYAPHILILCLFLVVLNCNLRDKELNSLDSLIKLKNKDVKEKESKIKSLEKDIALYNKMVKELNKEILKKEKSIQETKIKTEKQKKEVQKYTSNQIVKFYQKRYNTKEVNSLDNKVIFSDTICKKNITELIDFDGVKVELQKTQEVLLIERQKITSKDSIIQVQEKQKVLHDSISMNLKDVNNVQADKIEEQQEQLNKKARTNRFWKIATGVSFLIAIFARTVN